MRGGSVSKKRRFLSPNRISELVWDSKSKDAATSNDSMSEDEGDFQDKPGVSPATGPPDIQWSSVLQFDVDRCL
jgi:hypothetical protein